MNMFCFQCQETARGTGCTIRGVCGKPADVSRLQDLLIYLMKGLSICSLELKKANLTDEKADKFIIEGLFSTITNVNFDKDYFIEKIKEGIKLREQIKSRFSENGIRLDRELHDAAVFQCGNDDEMLQKAESVGILATEDEDIRSLKELIIYGLKGMAAYTDHACILGFRSEEINEFMQKALAATLDDSLTADDLTALVLETGKFGVEAMALLDKANTTSYGNPEITKVSIGVRNNPGILISGHDLKDMEELLKQTEGTGVDVYTHGEMLPANYYPAFKKYGHFVGNYGNAWWKQDKEFESFNGPVLMTTNCLIPPKDSYKDRVYTTGVVGFGLNIS